MCHTTTEELNEIRIKIMNSEIKDINESIIYINKAIRYISIASIINGLLLIIHILTEIK